MLKDVIRLYAWLKISLYLRHFQATPEAGFGIQHYLNLTKQNMKKLTTDPFSKINPKSALIGCGGF